MRVSEILFPFFLFLILFLTVLMYGEVEPNRLKELRFLVDANHVWAGYQLFCWLGAAQSIWQLHGQVKEEKSWRLAVFWVWLTGAAAAVGWSLFSYCIYGNAGSTGLVFPLASAMTLAHFPGNVIGRLDAVFVFAWIIGLFLLCSSLFAPLVDGEPDRHRKYLLFALLTASFAFACSPECMEWGQRFLYYVSTPLQILVLLWHGIWKKGQRGKRIAVSCMILLPAVFLCGCSAQELERQSLVTAVGVDVGQEAAYRLTFGFGSADGEESEEEDGKEAGAGERFFVAEASSLEEAKELYQEYEQKNMDFNHLKNFYFSREMLKEESFSELLEEIQVHGAYSRGTLVYVTEMDAKAQAKKEEQPDEGVPIHRVLNAWYNGEECEIPVVRGDGRYRGWVSWP